VWTTYPANFSYAAVFSPQKKQIVQIALLPPRSFLLYKRVLIAHRFHGFAVAPRLLEDFALLLAQCCSRQL